MLLHISDVEPSLAGYDARRGLELAGDELEQSGLTDAVAAYKTDFITRVDVKAHILEQRTLAEGHTELADG